MDIVETARRAVSLEFGDFLGCRDGPMAVSGEVDGRAIRGIP